MTSLCDRPNTALLVVDVQNDVEAKTYHRDEVIANIITLVDRARAQQVPVIWVQHAGERLLQPLDDVELTAGFAVVVSEGSVRRRDERLDAANRGLSRTAPPGTGLCRVPSG
jgi:nicotinamidase-related amidase